MAKKKDPDFTVVERPNGIFLILQRPSVAAEKKRAAAAKYEALLKREAEHRQRLVPAAAR